MIGQAVYPNEGLPILFLQLWKATAAPATPWQFFLFANDVDPEQDTVAGDVTVATFTGYSAEQVNRSLWLTPTIIADRAVSTYGATPILWTATAGFQLIYGYGIIEPVANKLLLIEQFTDPIDLAETPIIGVLPRSTLTTEDLTP